MILLLDAHDLNLIVLEQDLVLLVQVVAEVLTVEDGLELSQELERVLDVADDLEVLIDVSLEGSLNR